MNGVKLECLQSYEEFQSVRADWDQFMDCCFPENYARTHSWLSAFWGTHHAGRRALIYIQRATADGRIVAAAPLYIKPENFGGFRVRMLQTLGRGIGGDDFLIGTDACQPVQAVFADLDARQEWDVTIFRRVGLARFQAELTAVSRAMNCRADVAASTEHLVVLPETYGEYLASRSSKFRNNLKNAVKRLEAAGAVTIEILSPVTQAKRALKLCEEVAQKSWQFKAGKSHFNKIANASFYDNLARSCRDGSGEEFVVLLSAGRPVAFLLGCRRGRTYHLVDTAYDEAYRHVSVGRILFCKTIERLIESSGIDRFSLEGDGDYKDFYANETQSAQEITIYNRSLYGRCIGFVRNTGVYHFAKRLQQRGTGTGGQAGT